MEKLVPLLVALLASVSSLTGASTTPEAPLSPAAAAPVMHDVPEDVSASENWAGYVDDSGTYTGVGASWTVPASDSSVGQSFASNAAWVGIGGVGGTDLIQAGTEAITIDGEVEYQAWYEILPDVQHRLPLTVHAGDTVNVSLEEASEGLWILTFKNETTGKTYTKKLRYDSSKSSAEWIEERPVVLSGRRAGYAPLSSFGTVQFTNAYAIRDGTRTNLADLDAQPVSMVSGDLMPLASPSKVADDSSFSVAETSEALAPSAAPQEYAAAQYPRRRVLMIAPDSPEFLISFGL